MGKTVKKLKGAYYLKWAWTLKFVFEEQCGNLVQTLNLESHNIVLQNAEIQKI